MIKKFLNQDKISVGVAAVLAIELLCLVIVAIVLMALGLPMQANLKYFVVAFLPGFLVMRHFMKEKSSLNTTKGAITTVFVTFVAFMIVWLKYSI